MAQSQISLNDQARLAAPRSPRPNNILLHGANGKHRAAATAQKQESPGSG